MKTHFDIEGLVESGSITNELDYERAIIADRKLRLLSKEDAQFKNLRSKLRSLIGEYESKEWNDVNQIDDEKLSESERSGHIAEMERQFVERRKQAIRKKLKELKLTQEALAGILGHKSKTYMSELMNGIKPFTLRDLVIISRLFKIEMSLLVPVFLSHEDELRINKSIQNLDKQKSGVAFIA